MEIYHNFLLTSINVITYTCYVITKIFTYAETGTPKCLLHKYYLWYCCPNYLSACDILRAYVALRQPSAQHKAQKGFYYVFDIMIRMHTTAVRKKIESLSIFKRKSRRVLLEQQKWKIKVKPMICLWTTKYVYWLNRSVWSNSVFRWCIRHYTCKFLKSVTSGVLRHIM